jgi:AcrR family transcriptional regulator
MGMSASTSMSTRGRPRDPAVEDRVFDTAISLYSRVGWAGFNFGAVARESGIGKAALYRRWSDRGELLLDTLNSRWMVLPEINAGSLRDDLIRVAEVLLENMTSEAGNIYGLLMSDVTRYAEVRTLTAPYRDRIVRAALDIVKRAKERGDVPDSADTSLILDLVVGGISNHVASTPPELQSAMRAQMHSFAHHVVDVVLAGIAATEGSDSAAARGRTDHGPRVPPRRG